MTNLNDGKYSMNIRISTKTISSIALGAILERGNIGAIIEKDNTRRAILEGQYSGIKELPYLAG